jgi:hypothetical protein
MDLKKFRDTKKIDVIIYTIIWYYYIGWLSNFLLKIYNKSNSNKDKIYSMWNTNKQSPLASDRPFEKSIINQLPESVDLTEKLKQQSL